MGGGGAGTGGPSGADRITAGTLDVVTLPIQAPFLVAGAAKNAAEKSTVDSVEAIRKNPQHILTHRRQLSESTFRKAILDPTIPFTEAQLRQLSRSQDWTNRFVLANPRCPKDVLEAVWAKLPQLPDSERSSVSYYLASNPNVPDTWLESMVTRPDLYDASSKYAEAVLTLRKAEKLTPSASPSKPTAPSPRQR